MVLSKTKMKENDRVVIPAESLSFLQKQESKRLDSRLLTSGMTTVWHCGNDRKFLTIRQ